MNVNSHLDTTRDYRLTSKAKENPVETKLPLDFRKGYLIQENDEYDSWSLC
jgi:hypothetical protein